MLNTTSIRYEVIYKNLVRDVRKYYNSDFQVNRDIKKVTVINYRDSL